VRRADVASGLLQNEPIWDWPNVAADDAEGRGSGIGKGEGRSAFGTNLQNEPILGCVQNRTLRAWLKQRPR